MKENENRKEKMVLEQPICILGFKVISFFLSFFSKEGGVGERGRKRERDLLTLSRKC